MSEHIEMDWIIFEDITFEEIPDRDNPRTYGYPGIVIASSEEEYCGTVGNYNVFQTGPEFGVGEFGYAVLARDMKRDDAIMFAKAKISSMSNDHTIRKQAC